MRGPWRPGLLAGLLLAVFFSLAFGSLLQKSVTTDEVPHIGAGISYWRTGDYRLNPEHPPFMKLLCTLPLHLSSIAVDMSSPFFEAGDQTGFGRQLFEDNGVDLGGLLPWARLPAVLLGTLLGWMIFSWGCRLAGPFVGVSSLALYCFSPNFLAHTRWVTTDVPAALGIFGASYGWWLYLRHRSRIGLFGMALCLGLGMLSKFSVVFLLPALAVIGLVEIVRSRSGERSQMWVRFVTALALSLLAFLLLSMLLYQTWSGPQAYVRGLFMVNENHLPYYESYLWGDFAYGRRWYYLPVAFALKTPLPFLLLLMLFAVRRGSLAVHDLHFLLVPIVAFLVPSMLLADNIGVRYLLPMVPFLMLMAGSAAAVIWQQRTGKWLLMLLLTWQVATSLSSWPHYLAYFNELIGNRHNGFHYLDDSNVDWGQDNGRVLPWLKEYGLTDARIFWVCMSPLRPQAYGVNGQEPTLSDLATPAPGIYVVSRHYALRKPSLYWLRYHRGPMEDIADSLLVVNLSHDGRETIRRTFEEAIRENPRDPRLFAQYGIFLAHGGQVAEAFDALAVSLRLRPESAEPLVWQGLLYLSIEETDKAVTVLEQALSLLPEHEDVARLLASARQKAGEADGR